MAIRNIQIDLPVLTYLQWWIKTINILRTSP